MKSNIKEELKAEFRRQLDLKFTYNSTITGNHAVLKKLYSNQKHLYIPVVVDFINCIRYCLKK